jgi:Protein of unknown function (DUF3592)
MGKKSQQPANWKVGCALLLFAMLLMGLGGLVANMMLFEPLQRQTQATTWTEVPCVIRELGVERHQMDRARSKSNSIAFTPKVVFEYCWEDRDYTSKTFWFSNRFLNSSDEVLELLKPYQEGNESRCWVNPQNPADAVLNRENPGISMIGGIFGCLVATLGFLGAIGSVYLIFKKTKKA